MIRKLFPSADEASAYDIDYAELMKKGYKGVIFDIDNTLVPHGAPADERAIAYFDSIHKLGFRTVLLSNNKEPRVKSFACDVSSEYIYKAGKPKREGYLRACDIMGLKPEEVLFVGDQLFTDIWGANNAGIFSILTSPISPREEIQIVLKRILEKPILAAYRRRKRHVR